MARDQFPFPLPTKLPSPTLDSTPDIPYCMRGRIGEDCLGSSWTGFFSEGRIQWAGARNDKEGVTMVEETERGNRERGEDEHVIYRIWMWLAENSRARLASERQQRRQGKTGTRGKERGAEERGREGEKGGWDGARSKQRLQGLACLRERVWRKIKRRKKKQNANGGRATY